MSSFIANADRQKRLQSTNNNNNNLSMTNNSQASTSTLATTKLNTTRYVMRESVTPTSSTLPNSLKHHQSKYATTQK